MDYPHNDQNFEPVHKVSISISIMTLLVDGPFFSRFRMSFRILVAVLEDSKAIALQLTRPAGATQREV